ncbi:hypothetical protein HWQ46_05160 [Shewanella sp. D64]|uniref:bacteriohemerythrin n=1 Tax=unclassified Shewanella TaxID=196818 RepID=UPI0022BA2EC9|nr:MULTISPECIES: hemerythrin domain-containing protein [unclassified Shewanella]MEC4724940.1 hypothetical protein [Shewanella sp. D64]MEC4736267.1 hypothetical protein [Shewanella sp. E94]WBJ97669.1 hypothetical protein HWQ47_11530 [Shewanella sp. MTB7]
MKIFIWDDDFKTNFHDVDEQHEYLVELINKLGAFIYCGYRPIKDLNILLHELSLYASYHFKCEEEYMVRKGIDSRHFNYHVTSHVTFLERVTNVVSDIRPHDTSSITELHLFLISWLNDHILGVDQNMARQLRSIENGLTSQQAYDKEEIK